MIHVGELALLAVGCLLFERNKQSLRKLGRIAVISLCSFFMAMGFIGGFMGGGPFGEADNVVGDYIKSNAISLSNPDARSNRARYSVMEADVKIGVDHPIVGVGWCLRSGYMPDYFSEKALQDGEVKMWLDFQKKLGVLRSGIPVLGNTPVVFPRRAYWGWEYFWHRPFSW